jgi:hypothetical protein
VPCDDDMDMDMAGRADGDGVGVGCGQGSILSCICCKDGPCEDGVIGAVSAGKAGFFRVHFVLLYWI